MFANVHFSPGAFVLRPIEPSMALGKQSIFYPCKFWSYGSRGLAEPYLQPGPQRQMDLFLGS